MIVKHWNKAIFTSEPWPEAGLGEHIPAQLRKKFKCNFFQSPLLDRGSQFWAKSVSSLAQVLLARMREGPSRFGMREFCFLAPFQSLLLVLLCLLSWVSTTQPTREGWGFLTPALGHLGLKPWQGKTKFQLFYSPFLCILWTKTVILIELRFSCATQSWLEMFSPIVRV